MQPAQSLSQEHDASASASDPPHADGRTPPRKKPTIPEALFLRASRANSLPDFIEVLEVARNPSPGYARSHPYPDVIKTGLIWSIMEGRTSLAAHLLENEPLAPAIMRERILPSDVGQNPSIPLDLLIVQHGWDVNTEGILARDKRPLISWVLQQQDDYELVCWLLDRGAGVDFWDDKYARETLWPRPPALLETCARFGSVESYRLLQAKGARLGRRAFHFCSTAAACGADPGVASSLDQDEMGREDAELGGEDDDADAQAKGLVQRLKRAAMLRYLVDEVGFDVNQTDTDIILTDRHYGTLIYYAAREERGPAVVLEQWRELNPEKVQERQSSDTSFETPPFEWKFRTWQEWEAYHREEVEGSNQVEKSG